MGGRAFLSFHIAGVDHRAIPCTHQQSCVSVAVEFLGGSQGAASWGRISQVVRASSRAGLWPIASRTCFRLSLFFNTIPMRFRARCKCRPRAGDRARRGQSRQRTAAGNTHLLRRNRRGGSTGKTGRKRHDCRERPASDHRVDRAARLSILSGGHRQRGAGLGRHGLHSQ